MPAIHNVPVFTNTTALALEAVPRHLVVLSGSYVGLEFAQIFCRFGAEVTVLDGETRTVHDRIAAYALYTDPPLGRAGMTEAEVCAAGRNVLVASMAMEETAGLMKLVVDADTRKILGAAILETGGDEVIHCILDLMYPGAPCTVLQRAMHIHPTAAELLPSLAEELVPVG